MTAGVRHEHARSLPAARLLPAVLLSGLLTGVAAGDAGAQLKGHYPPGFTGLENGTQAPPGISVFLPAYFYTTDDIRNDAGESLGAHPRITSTFIGPGIAWVTNARVFGANLGGSVAPIAYIKSRLEGNSLDVPGSFEFSDIYAQPVQLGWQGARADVVAAYGLFMPTGKWESGADDNGGLGMWSHQLQAGTTLRLDTRHAWTLSSLASYEIHTHKKNSDLRVGDILTLEGGLGRSFYRMATADGQPMPSVVTTVGLVYYAQWKLTSDEGGAASPLLAGREDRVYAAGLEANAIFAKPGLVLDLRALPEFGARNRTQGWTFLFTIAYELKSLVRAPERAAQPTR